MKINLLLVLLLHLSPTIAFADNKGKSIKWWSTPLIIVLYIGFFLFAAGVAFCVRQLRDRGDRGDYHGGLGIATERGLDAKEIEALPSLKFSEVMKLHGLGYGEHGVDKQVECAVCLAEFKDQEVISILPECFHVFHPYCIAPWLASHATCPTCRSSLDHSRQGSSFSKSSIYDGISGSLSQRFDHSAEQNHNNDDDHVTVEIEGESSALQSEVNRYDSPQPALTHTTGKLYRPYSMSDLMIHIVGRNSATMPTKTTLSSFLPKESSPKSDYRSTTVNNADNWNCLSPKSDRFVDYSSLILVEMESTSMSASYEK